MLIPKYGVSSVLLAYSIETLSPLSPSPRFCFRSSIDLSKLEKTKTLEKRPHGQEYPIRLMINSDCSEGSLSVTTFLKDFNVNHLSDKRIGGYWLSSQLKSCLSFALIFLIRLRRLSLMSM